MASKDPSQPEDAGCGNRSGIGRDRGGSSRRHLARRQGFFIGQPGRLRQLRFCRGGSAIGRAEHRPERRAGDPLPDADGHDASGPQGADYTRATSPPARSRPRSSVTWRPSPSTGRAPRSASTSRRTRRPSSGNCTLTVPREPADRAGPGHSVPARRRLLQDQPGTAGLRRGDDPVAQRPGPGVQPADHHPGHQARALRPAAPRIPRGARVILDFGFNGTNLVLTGPGAFQRSSGCVDALGQSVIGQVSACNAVAFYSLANAEIAQRHPQGAGERHGIRRSAVPDDARLRADRPGPERQHLLAVPARRQGPDGAGHRGQQGHGWATRRC